MGRWGPVLVLGGVLCAPAAEAAGPWRAQVVDAESGQPLPDVAVLAVWHRHPAGHPPIPIGFGRAGYFASEESVTGPDGWFTIPARVLFNARGRVYVVDRASPRVHVLGPLPGG